MSRTFAALTALVASASAFTPGPTAFARHSMALNAGIVDTISSLQGPEIYWGAEGVLQGHEESDIMGYDNFSKLAAALKASGIDLSSGDYTILAPSDSAVDKHMKEVGTPIDDDILKFHVIPGKKTLDQLNVDQDTLQGTKLTSYRKFRKNWLDFAILGLQSEGASKSASWPANVDCDNGIIHGIDTVLVPGAYTGSR